MSKLSDVCLRLKSQIAKDYDIGPGDAEDLFGLIWAELAAGRFDKATETAITVIEDVFF
jgi:hypothetical protein